MKVIKSAFLRHPLYWYGKKVYYKQYIYIILTFIWLDINVDIDIHHFMLLTRFVFRDTRIINETNSRIIFQTFGCREKRSFLYWWVTVCSGIYKISLGGPTFLERKFSLETILLTSLARLHCTVEDMNQLCMWASQKER